jgi:hypothetical protein
MDRERIPYAPPYRRKSIINEVRELWHKEFYHSSTKRRKRYGNDGAGRITSSSGSGKYFLYQHVEEVSIAGCSKMPGCKAPEILSREAYFLVR